MEENKVNTDDKREVKEAFNRLGFDWDEHEAFWEKISNRGKSEPKPEKPSTPLTKLPWQTWVIPGIFAK